MKYKIISCITAIIILFSPTYSLALTEGYEYAYEYEEDYTESEWDRDREDRESDIITPYEYFRGREFRDGIPEVAVTRIVIGGDEGRGAIHLRSWPSSPITTVIECPTNPGDPALFEKTIAQPLGKWQSFSLYADEGELFFKEISGVVTLEDGTKEKFIIRFDER